MGEYEWGKAGNHINLKITEMSTELIVYGIYAIDLPADSTDQVITGVSVIGVNKNLDASSPVTFTAKAATWCADKFDVTEEAWELSGSANDIIKSTDAAPRAPIAGGEYWYSIVLTAKDGYVFSKDFSDSNHRIKEGSEVSFAVGGFLYENKFYVSDDGKTLTAWEFMDPTTVTGNTQKLIDEASISDAIFDYQSGDAPLAGAKLSLSDDLNKYEIVYECWQQFENNEPVAAWYSDNGSHGSLPTITAFESGKRYVYSLMLKPKDGYSFSSETVITVNGQRVAAPFVGGSMYIPSIKTITMPTVTVIDVVEINDVTVSFKDGDKPVFTGNVPDGANYAYRCEWWELDSKTGAMSTDFGNFYENKFTAFEAGKTYHYGVYVTTVYGDNYVFGPDTKLKINGEFVNYKRYEGDTSDGSDGTMWVITDLTMTPQTAGTTPDYKIIEGANGTWTKNTDGTLTFRANGDFSAFTEVKVDGNTIPADKYTAASGSTVITLKRDYLDTLSAGKHILTIVYSDGVCSTEFEIKEQQTVSNTPAKSEDGKATESKPNDSGDRSPKTGDSVKPVLLMFTMLFAVGIIECKRHLKGLHKSAK